MPDDNKTIGDRLRARRVERGLTLHQVAERAHLSLAYVSNLERGRGNPTLEALRAVAEALEVPLSSILGSTDVADAASAIVAAAPRSLLQFMRGQTFTDAVQRLAQRRQETPEEVRQRLLVAMASAPRRSSGEPTEDDWRRLLDTYFLILQE